MANPGMISYKLKIPPYDLSACQTITVNPPEKIPHRALNLFIFLEYNENKIVGPNALPNPAQAKDTNWSTVFWGLDAYVAEINIIKNIIILIIHTLFNLFNIFIEKFSVNEQDVAWSWADIVLIIADITAAKITPDNQFGNNASADNKNIVSGLILFILVNNNLPNKPIKKDPISDKIIQLIQIFLEIFSVFDLSIAMNLTNIWGWPK